MLTLRHSLFAVALLGVSLPAGAANWSLGAEAGTTGFGGSLSYRFNDNLALTGSYGGFSYDGIDHETDDADYEGDADVDVYGLTLDYFPFAGRFFVSLGAVRPDIAVQVVGRPKAGGSYEFNGRTYTAAEVGTLEGKASLGDSVQPYLGIGWRGSHAAGLGMFGRLGAFLTDAEVDLHATGAASDPRLAGDVQREEDDLQDDLDDYGFYPVAVVGLEYTF
ncbi:MULTISPECIES: hypothetical protein [Modicisalibacter]|uniref:hypothetical protein n=1 Tax=Modicisalibacter TaxID=574347 RepID=UPI00100B475D|nr:MULTISPECIES: hypothetical protein [Halomonadaceae]MBZ9559220.1 hypothetical protein [Modicisalibacter sp. R2A 31.J]MBZ9576615.1 hypothetical protein [Modicisalibacter sp. MOD 31.J]